MKVNKPKYVVSLRLTAKEHRTLYKALLIARSDRRLTARQQHEVLNLTDRLQVLEDDDGATNREKVTLEEKLGIINAVLSKTVCDAPPKYDPAGRRRRTH